jgi:hypothetical protein
MARRVPRLREREHKLPGLRDAGCARPARACRLPQPEIQIHRVGPEFSNWVSSLIENPY